MLTAIAAIVIFSLLITIHEFGHFITSKIFGVKVHEFSIGMGPAILKWGKGETKYSVRILPIGGYVKLEGEDEESDDEKALNNQPNWKKLIILAAGSFMNLLLGLIVAIIFVAPADSVGLPVIDSFLENSPAQEAGLQVGDRITEINGCNVHNLRHAQILVFIYGPDGSIEVDYKRDGKKYQAEITPGVYDGQYLLGFQGKIVENTPLRTIQHGYHEAVFTGKSIFIGIKRIFTGSGMSEVSGPVGIVSVIGDAVDETQNDLWNGISYLLYLLMNITISLGVMNLLPIPALDGGRILFTLIEMITRKKIPPEKEGVIHLIGFGLLIALMIFATYGDIMRLIKG